ncbi:MAG TPA: DUF3240 domain-containing protein [Gammaproteobacteria bacterium]|nr:DUF3240 domain-containing protein [Gammaproteobacteria bacterium]
MGQCLLVLIVSPAMENTLVDWLLEHEDIPGFTSATVSGHGASTSSLSAAEQVTGKQLQVMFKLHLQEGVARTVIDEVRDAFGGSGIHYWMTPVLASGHLT